MGVVNRLGDRVDQPVVAIGGKINREPGTWRDTDRDLKVQCDLFISVQVHAKRIASAIDGDVNDRRYGHIHRGAGGGQVVGPVSAGGLNETDALPGARTAGAQPVKRGDLGRQHSGSGAFDRARAVTFEWPAAVRPGRAPRAHRI